LYNDVFGIEEFQHTHQKGNVFSWQSQCHQAIGWILCLETLSTSDDKKPPSQKHIQFTMMCTQHHRTCVIMKEYECMTLLCLQMRAVDMNERMIRLSSIISNENAHTVTTFAAASRAKAC